MRHCDPVYKAEVLTTKIVLFLVYKTLKTFPVSGSQKGGITSITYRRPLAASEPIKDKEILTTRSQSVIAAFGPLNSRYEANAHSFMDTTRSDVQLDFGAQVCIIFILIHHKKIVCWLGGNREFFLQAGVLPGNRL